MPELERAARQWAADFLNEKLDTVSVMTDTRRVHEEHCEDRSIILFKRAPAGLLRHVLQSGGRPWLVTEIACRPGHGAAHSR